MWECVVVRGVLIHVFSNKWFYLPANLIFQEKGYYPAQQVVQKTLIIWGKKDQVLDYRMIDYFQVSSYFICRWKIIFYFIEIYSKYGSEDDRKCESLGSKRRARSSDVINERIFSQAT